MAQRPKILQDHRKKGQLLISPFNHLIGPINEISWIKTIIPEIVWIALVQDNVGHKEGVRVLTAVAREIRSVTGALSSTDAPARVYATVSSFSTLSEIQGTLL